MRNWEDWAFGLSLAAAIAAVLAIKPSSGPEFTTEAIAAETKADYVMTITAKRLPAECKGVAYESMSADCAAILDNATETVRKAR